MVNRNRFKIRLALLKRRDRQVFAKLVKVSRGETVKLDDQERSELVEAAILASDGTLAHDMSTLVLEVEEEMAA